jgi:putative transposase
MPEIERLGGCSDWIDLEFIERERTPEPVVEMGIQLHLGGLSTRNTSHVLGELGVECSHVAVHNWVQKADLQPTSVGAPNQIAVDETVIRINDQRRWLYAAVDPQTNDLLHVRLFQARSTERTMLFLRELREKQPIEQATFLLDEAPHLRSALDRLGLRFQVTRHGNRNSVERVFRDVKRRTSSFSNAFSHVSLGTAESWLQAFVVWWNRC